MLDVTVQNLVARLTWRPECVRPCNRPVLEYATIDVPYSFALTAEVISISNKVYHRFSGTENRLHI
jgi:hypothetical protein